MKRILIILVSIALLLFSLAALDDITTGDQPNFYLEWIVVSLSIAWFLGLITRTIALQKGERRT